MKKILFFAGSLRADSLNKKLAKEALNLTKEFTKDFDVDVEFIDLKDYQMPIYDGDIETNSGIPEQAKALSKKILAANAMIISTPEYNAGITGVLKNVIDWLSRERPNSFTDKHLLLLSASISWMGGHRGLWHTRQPFEQVGVHVFPEMLGLPDASNAFDENDKLKDEANIKRLKTLIEKFIKHINS